MKHYLLTLLLAAACIPATAQDTKTEKPEKTEDIDYIHFRRHNIGLNFIYTPQYATGSNGRNKARQYNRLGGDINYRFCIFPSLRVGVFYENSSPNKIDQTVYTVNDIYGFTLDIPLWIKNRVGIAPGFMSNIRVPSDNSKYNFGSPITGGVYVNIMVRMTKSIALSAEAGSRKMPLYGYRQYPMRFGMKIFL